MFQPIAEAVREARSHFIGALALLAKQIERTAEGAAGAEFVHATAENKNAIANLFSERLLQVGDVLIEFAARLHDEFGSSGWSRSADVRDKIGHCEIGFMADA